MGKLVMVVAVALGVAVPTASFAKPKPPSKSSSHSAHGAGRKPAGKPKGGKCVAGGGFTNNAGNCCSHRYAGPVKATDLHNQCK